MQPRPDLVLDARATLGEGALWHAPTQRLWWVDIEGHAVHIFDPATGGDRAIPVGQHVGTIVPRRQGGAMVALRRGLAALDVATGQCGPLIEPADHPAENRFNDGKCDTAGRFWAGTMPMQGSAPTGGLYRLDAGGSLTRVFGGVACSNGIAWSLDRRTMYYIDTPTARVDAFDYDHATGAVTNRRPAITVPAKEMGWPDGSTLDAEGMLWIAHWGGSRVTRWNPVTGKLLGHVELPVTQVTACAFGGPKLDRLYITTARISLDAAAIEKQPLAGGLFCVAPGVIGLPAVEFVG